MFNLTIGSGWTFTPLDMHLLGACSILFWFGVLALIAAVVYKIVDTAFSIVDTQAANKERMNYLSKLHSPFLAIIQDGKADVDLKKEAVKALAHIYSDHNGRLPNQ